jgi:Zn-dependent M28 family amino/carboxypeptidase
MGIIAAGLLLIFSVTFLTWWVFMPERDRSESKPISEEAVMKLAASLESDVRYLSETIGERNMHRRGTMEVASSWIELRFQESGVHPQRETYQLSRGVYSGQSADNIVAELPGTDQADEIIIIGAHYDTVPGSPGANDNGTAVASLLALAEYFAEKPQKRTVRFVAFANEEPPFFKTEDMGSYAYARQMSDRGEKVTAMFSMDGLGYYSEEPGSQGYPLPGIGWIYPSRANFIAFVTRFSDLGLMKRSLKAFRESTELPAEGVALPGLVPGTDWSDHWSFWQHDIPAFLITDTLPYRDPHYHTANDMPDNIDFNKLSQLNIGLRSVVRELAN